MENYDLCVLGGGPSGYAAAMRAVDFGKKVILDEEAKQILPLLNLNTPSPSNP